MKLWKLSLGLLALGLSACVPVLVETGPRYAVTEIELLTPEASERWTYFYGDPQTVNLEGTPLVLEPAPDRAHIWAVPGALWVNGEPLLREVLPALRPPATTVEALPGFDYVTETRVALDGVWLYDGAWYRLADKVRAGARVRSEGDRASPRLRGLDPEETQVLLNEILARAGRDEVVLYQLSDPVFPDYRFDPRPRTYRKVSLAVQFGVAKEFVLGPVNPKPAPAWEVLQRGPFSAYADAQPYAVLATSEQAFLNKIWPLAAGRRVPRPAPPPVDFRSESVAAFFWGTKPTGGYALDVRSVQLKDGVLVVQLELRTPKPGSLVTQAITSPYLLLKVQGKPAKVRFLDAKGNLLEEARAE
jgi:hypothetical protein